MNTKINITLTGSLLTVSGIITLLMHSESPLVLRYVQAVVLISAGVFSLITGQEYRALNGRSKYFTGFGLIIITLTISLGIFGTTAATFTSILGFFLVLTGIVGFAFAQQLLIDREGGNSVAGIKFLIGLLLTMGGGWILTIADTYTLIAFRVSGGLLVLTGLILVYLGKMTGLEKDAGNSSL